MNDPKKPPLSRAPTTPAAVLLLSQFAKGQNLAKGQLESLQTLGFIYEVGRGQYTITSPGEAELQLYGLK